MKRFAELEFGSDDAKGDRRLAEYFLRIPEYDRVRSGRASFVIGRKGTGKTAICQMLDEEARADPSRFAARLSFKNAPTAALFASADARFLAPNQYISVWKFLIALEVAKIVAGRDEGVDSRVRRELEGFLRSNFGRIDVASLDAIDALKQRDWKVRLPLPVDLSAPELAYGSTDQARHRIHYAQAATSLLDLVARSGSASTYVLLFDELDEDYGKLPHYLDLAMSLMKATYQTRQEQRAGPQIWPVVVLREDIFLRLSDPDLNKLDDHIVRLRWESDTASRSRFSLRGVVEERMRASLGRPAGSTGIWSACVEDERWRNGAWHWIAARTMLRPRDAIKFLKIAQQLEKGQRMAPESAVPAAVRYSEWLYHEVGNEIFVELPEWRHALSLLNRTGSPFQYARWEAEFRADTLLAKVREPEDVLRLLFELGVVGMAHQNRRWMFRYAQPQLMFDRGALFGVHAGLRQHLRVVVQGSRYVKEPADPDLRYR